MSVFEQLPTVNKCCFCIELKYGAIFVAVCGILELFCSVLQTLHQRSRGCNSPFEDIIHGLAIVVVVFDSILCILSIGLIVAILRKIPRLAVFFMYSVCLSILGMFIMAIVLLIAGFSKKECLILVSDSISTFILCLIWVYFLLVVRSYYPQLEQNVVRDVVQRVESRLSRQ